MCRDTDDVEADSGRWTEYRDGSLEKDGTGVWEGDRAAATVVVVVSTFFWSCRSLNSAARRCNDVAVCCHNTAELSILVKRCELCKLSLPSKTCGGADDLPKWDEKVEFIFISMPFTFTFVWPKFIFMRICFGAGLGVLGSTTVTTVHNPDLFCVCDCECDCDCDCDE